MVRNDCQSESYHTFSEYCPTCGQRTAGMSKDIRPDNNSNKTAEKCEEKTLVNSLAGRNNCRGWNNGYGWTIISEDGCTVEWPS